MIFDMTFLIFTTAALEMFESLEQPTSSIFNGKLTQHLIFIDILLF